MNNIKQYIYSLSLITLALVFAIGVSIAIAAWSGPSQPPPLGNVDTPVNVGGSTQYKSGALGIGGLFRAYATAIFDGNVGIGTTNPSVGGEQNLKLDVEGAIGAKFYCDEDGNNCTSAPLGGGGTGDGWVMIGDPYRQELTGGGSDNRIYYNASQKINILSVPITMPSSGGPFKVMISYNVDGDRLGGQESSKVWVEDGFSSTKLGASRKYVGGGPIVGGSTEVSNVNYQNGQGVTFTLFGVGIPMLYEYMVSDGAVAIGTSMEGNNPEDLRGNWLSIQVFGKESGSGGGGSLNSTTFTNPTKTLGGTSYPLCLTVAGDTASIQMTTINQFCSEKGYEFGEVFDLSTNTGNYAYYYNSSWTNNSCGAKALSVKCFK